MSTDAAQVLGSVVPAAALLPADGSLDGTALAIVIGGALFLLFSLLFGLLLISRRQQSREVREMVVAVEELRSGQTRRRAEIDPRSSLAILGDAVNRLAQDLSGRFSDAAHAQEQLEGFLDAARDYGVVTTNADWDIRTFSQGASDLFGWAEEEADARPASLLFHDASWKDLLPKLARRSLRERGVEMRSVMTRREGGSFHADLLVRQLQGSGEDAGYLLVIKDVSTQVRLETELRDSESRYRSLVDGLSEGVVIVQDALVAYANPAVAEMLGVTDDRLGGRLLRRWVATRDLLVVEDAVSSVAGRVGERRVVRCTLVNGEGESVARVRMDASGIHHDGKPASLVAIIDETVEQQAAEQLRINQRRLDAVLESTTDGIVVLTETDGGSVVNMTNAAFLTTFGLSQDRLLGASESELLEMLRRQGGGAESVAEFLAATHGADRGEAITLADEPYRELELRLAPLIGDGGKVIGRVLACRDLTTQKAAEKELAARIEDLEKGKDALKQAYRRLHGINRDLSQRSEQLNNLNHELRKLEEMKSNLLANVSHELQTPLVSIRGYTEMILKGRLGATTEEQQKGLTLSLRNIDRLIAMIDNLLTFARTDRENAEIEMTTFPLCPVIDESLVILREKLDGKHIAVSQHLEDPDVVVRADRDKILQVFLNLLSNAIKFNRDDGRIEVASRTGDDAYVMVQVRDTGNGIPEDALEKIFDRFYQEGASLSGPEEGTGIGLAIVRNILRLHGCSIRAESTVGLGSTFSFTLPLAGPKQATSDAGPLETEAPATDAPEGQRQQQQSKAEPRPRFRVIRRPNRS